MSEITRLSLFVELISIHRHIARLLLFDVDVFNFSFVNELLELIILYIGWLDLKLLISNDKQWSQSSACVAVNFNFLIDDISDDGNMSVNVTTVSKHFHTVDEKLCSIGNISPTSVDENFDHLFHL